MAKLRIQPHGRLQEWVAHENGYFNDEGLDYEFRFLAPNARAGAPLAVPLGSKLSVMEVIVEPLHEMLFSSYARLVKRKSTELPSEVINQSGQDVLTLEIKQTPKECMLPEYIALNVA